MLETGHEVLRAARHAGRAAPVRKHVARAPAALAEEAAADPERPVAGLVSRGEAGVERHPALTGQLVRPQPGDDREPVQRAPLELGVAAHVMRLVRLIVQMHRG